MGAIFHVSERRMRVLSAIVGKPISEMAMMCVVGKTDCRAQSRMDVRPTTPGCNDPDEATARCGNGNQTGKRKNTEPARPSLSAIEIQRCCSKLVSASNYFCVSSSARALHLVDSRAAVGLSSTTIFYHL